MMLDIEPPEDWTRNANVEEKDEYVAAAFVYLATWEYFVEVYEEPVKGGLSVAVLSGTPGGGTWRRAEKHVETYEDAEDAAMLAMAAYTEVADPENDNETEQQNEVET